MTFSVIVPVYNTAPYLRACLESVLKAVCVLSQRAPDSAAEIICVDDGSTDGSAEILDAYADKVKVIHGMNAGVSVARNVALARASGECVCFADSDDVVSENWLLDYRNAFSEESADVVMQPGYKWIDDGYPWAYAVKRAIAIKAEFPRGVVMGEDGLYAAMLQPYVSCIRILDRKSYHHVERPGSAMFRILSSAERLSYLQTVLQIARQQPALDRRVLSRKVAAGIVYWLARPRDLSQRHQIRQVWKELCKDGCGIPGAAPRLYKWPYLIYCVTGCIWQLITWSRALECGVSIKKRMKV